MSCRFQRRTSNGISRSVARSRGSPLACRPRFRQSIDTRFRCMSSRKISRAKTCRLDRAAAWRFAMTFRLMASMRSRCACDGSIRTTSWAWAGRNSSTSASMARWSSGSPLEGKGRADPRRPVTPAMVSRDLPAIPSGKNTCRPMRTPGSRCACRSRPGRASSVSRSSGRCGSPKAFRSRCSAAGS